jgi:tripartite-type tricarboxylate transporter receptor subunit TctC
MKPCTSLLPPRRALLAALLATCCAPALAQGQQVVKVVVPFPPGGITDQTARVIIEKTSQVLGQTMVIDNRPGAGSRIGIHAVAKAPADGMTLMFTNSSYSILPVVDPKSSIDPQKTLAPVAMVATYSLGILVSNKVPANTLPEFIAYAKNHPGKLSYGSAGPGSGSHFAGEHFKALTGTSIVHVPYKSTSQALNDVAGGTLDLTYDGAAKPYVDGGKVKLLAVAGAKRDPRFPNVPTAAESGLKDFVLNAWAGFLAPAGTPAATIERLNRAVNDVLADPQVRRTLADLGMQPQGGPADVLATQIKQDVALHRKIAADAKLSFD